MKRATLAVLAGLLALTRLGVAAQPEEWTQLQQRFAARDAQVQQIKASRMAGEASTGYLEVPDASVGAPAITADARRVMDEENTDRRRLYLLIAEREGVPAEAVADRAARRNFARARPGELLRYPDGIWRLKP